MKTPPPTSQPQITPPQPLEKLSLSALGVPRSVADELYRDQLAVRATTVTPQLRALLADTGHDGSVLND